MNKEIEEERRNGEERTGEEEGGEREERRFEGEELDAHEVNKYTGLFRTVDRQVLPCMQ